MDKNKRNIQIVKISVLIVSIFAVFFTITYAFLNQTVTGTKSQVITSGNLKLNLNEGNELTLNNALPMYDEVGMIQEPFPFTLTNEGNTTVNYVLRLVEINTENKLDTNYIRYGLMKDEKKTIDSLSNLANNELDSGYISKNQMISYELRLWIDASVEDENLIKDKSLSYRIEVEIKQGIVYKEKVLNGTDPVLSDNLVPVTIADDGTVTKADTNEVWYNYEKQQWANAVVLEDNVKEYRAGDTIEETNIESYFVWIPRYKYKIFNDETYTGVTTLENRVQTIEVEFETKDTEVSNGTVKDEWLSHPAFQAFDSNGFWVGKFETGYRGATTTAGAQVNSSDSSKIVVKPNTYSWRNITVGNAFKASYDYLRSDESHMMKNTEWGAVAYLQHSVYGSRASVRVNNNNSYKTGYASVSEPTCGQNRDVSTSCNLIGNDASVTQPYNTKIGYTASTTGNITGIYDMSGGAWEYVMGYNMGAGSGGGSSGITSLYSDFFTNSEWDKYYDKYTSSSNTDYNNRILGDATGEMGPFFDVTAPIGIAYHNSSWYNDYGYFSTAANPWFRRSSGWSDGSTAGIFSFHSYTGAIITGHSFRLVLAF